MHYANAKSLSSGLIITCLHAIGHCSLAKDEYEQKLSELEDADACLLHALAPSDAADEKSALLEIRAGTGIVITEQ